MHIISEKKLGIPQNSKYIFEVLCSDDMINSNLMNKLKVMVGFRNIGLHNYQVIDLKIVEEIIEKHLDDIREFSKIIIKNI